MAVSIKQKRLEGIIRKNISDIVQFQLKDPNVGFVTITDVKVSNDHSYATVFCTFIGSRGGAVKQLRALDKAKGFIRTELSQRLDIRRCPELIFKIDEAAEYGKKIDAIIAKIHENDPVEPVATLDEEEIEESEE